MLNNLNETLYSDKQLEGLFPFWKDIPLNNRDILRKIIIRRLFSKHLPVDFTPESHVWGIIKGHVNVIMYADTGKQIHILNLKQGDSGMRLDFRDKGKNAYHIEAVAEADTEICEILNPYGSSIPKESLWAFERNWYSFILSNMVNLFGRVVFLTLGERVVLFLQEQSALQKNDIISMTHEQLGEELGSSREVVSRLLTQLSKSGLVELKRKRIRLRKI